MCEGFEVEYFPFVASIHKIIIYIFGILFEYS